MPFGVDELLAALDLEAVGRDSYRGRSPDAGWRRVFGGLVVAQALVAAERTVSDRPAHALHGLFLRPGDPGTPIVYDVERLRDGGSFSTRRCLACQHGEAIFSLSASFHLAEDRNAFDHAHVMPQVPEPEAVPALRDFGGTPLATLPAAVARYLDRDALIELRPIEASRYTRPGSRPFSDRQHVWMRTSARLPDDPAIHRAVLAYMSDMTLLDTALAFHGRSVFEPELQVASLDHALWFHRPARADDWLLYSQDSPSASGARGFARGSIFSRAGVLAASTAQEGLIRRRAATRPSAG